MNRELYTKHQLSILDGEIPFEQVQASNYTRIIKIAEANDDTEVLGHVRPLLAEKRKRFREKRRAENRQYYAEHREACNEYTKTYYREHIKPERGPYTSRQLAIIRNEISYENTTAADYTRIRRIASKLGNFALANLMDDLISEKRRDQKEKNIQATLDRYYKKLYDNADDKEKMFTLWEMKVLNGEISCSKTNMKQLNVISRKARMIGNPEYIEAIEYAIALKKDPKSIYITMDPVEAWRIIESHTIFPIRHPSEWV